MDLLEEASEHDSRTISASESPVPDQSLAGSISHSAAAEGPWMDPFPHLSTDELEARLKAVEDETMHFKCEMDMFEKYLAKATARQQQEEEGPEDVAGPRRRRHSRQQRGAARAVADQLQLTAQQKCDVAAVCLDDLKLNADRQRQHCEEELCDIMAALEEVEQRGTELRKTEYDFTREIVQGAVRKPTGKVQAEVVERYFEERGRTRDLLIEQLRLKDARLKVACAKVAQQRRQREESGEVLHEVDFRQLQIENTQIVEKTKERNTEMLRLKLSAGNLVQVLNDHNKELQRLRAAGVRLQDETRARSALLQRLTEETASVEDQRQGAQQANAKLRKMIESHRVAPVMEYVREAAAQHGLGREVATMERKVEVAKGELRRFRQPRGDTAPSSSTRVAFGATMPRSAPSKARWA